LEKEERRQPEMKRFALLSMLPLLCLFGCATERIWETAHPVPGEKAREMRSSAEEAGTHEEASPRDADVTIIRSQLYLSRVFIKQWHIKQPEPVWYGADRISQVRLEYGVHQTGERFLRRAVIFLNDGSVKTHTPVKVMSVTLGVNGGNVQKPVEILQCIDRSNP
jgi:hypothetical protein